MKRQSMYGTVAFTEIINHRLVLPMTIPRDSQARRALSSPQKRE
jgi:hypothetical protein